MSEFNRGYQLKTIKSIVAAKVNKWLSSIEDDKLRKQVRENTIVTGGSITSLLLGDDPNDFDIFFKDLATVRAVAEHYVKLFRDKHGYDADRIKIEEKPDSRGISTLTIKIRSDGVAGTDEAAEADTGAETVVADGSVVVSDATQMIVNGATDTQNKSKAFRPIFLSRNAITLSDKVQLVLRFYGSAEQIHSTFDFAHTKCWYDVYKGELHVPVTAARAIMSKSLIYTGSYFPVCSVLRMRKFISRGWRMSAGSVLKMCLQISKLDLESLDVLEEQVLGCDTAYMLNMLAALRAKHTDRVPHTYVAEVLDQLFDDA